MTFAGVPCVGKSANAEFLKGAGWNYVSSDEVAHSLKERGISKVQAIKKAGRELWQNIFELVASSREARIIIVDKNSPPNSWRATKRNLNESSRRSQHPIVSVLMIPYELCAADDYQISFNPSLLLLCIVRILARTDHPTLNGTDADALLTLLRFFKLYDGYSRLGTVDEARVKAMEAGFDVVRFYKVLTDLGTEDQSDERKQINDMIVRVFKLYEKCPLFGETDDGNFRREAECVHEMLQANQVYSDWAKQVSVDAMVLGTACMEAALEAQAVCKSKTDDSKRGKGGKGGARKGGSHKGGSRKGGARKGGKGSQPGS